MRRAFSAAIAILVFAGFARAQNLGSTLTQVGAPYGNAYVTPAANEFGMDLNSGLFHGATMGGILPFGLHLYLGVQFTGALVPSSERAFSLSYMDTLNDPTLGKLPANYSVTNAPTIFGSKDAGSVVITPDNPAVPARTVSTVGGLVNTSIALVPIPQLGVGSIFGTDLTVRYLPKMKLLNYGSVQLLGFAIRHNLSQYIPLIPIDVAVQIGWQNFSISDSSSEVFKGSAFAANLEVSKTLLMITLYGGLQVESSSFDVNYNFTPPSTPSVPNPQSVPISFKVKGKNHFRALLGFAFGFGPLTINADYSVGAVNAITAGIGVGI